MTSSGTLKPGSIFLTRYQVLGSFGRQMWIAHDPIDDRMVVIWLAPPSAHDDVRVQHYFAGMAEAGDALDHLRIARVIDGGITDEFVYALIDCPPDFRPLRSVCAVDALLEVRELTDVFSKIALALNHAHQRGFVHGALSPEQIWINPAREVKLVGFSSMPQPPVNDDELKPYLAPEQLAGRVATTVADFYALGSMLYEALTGHRHQRGAHDSVAERAVTPAVRDLRQDVPAALERVVERLVAPLPAQRYQQCADLAGDLSVVTDLIRSQPSGVSANGRFITLRAARFFERFDDRSLWEILRPSYLKHFPDESVVDNSKSANRNLHVVISGGVTLFNNARPLETLGPGTSFGAEGLVAEAPPATTALAAADTTLLVIPARVIEHLSVACQLRLHAQLLQQTSARLAHANRAVVGAQPRG